MSKRRRGGYLGGSTVIHGSVALARKKTKEHNAKVQLERERLAAELRNFERAYGRISPLRRAKHVVEQKRAKLRTERKAKQVLDGVETAVPLDLVVRMLTYKPMQERQKALLGVLYRASDWISAANICRQMRIDKRQLTGVLRGIGLRCEAQRGWPRGIDTGERTLRHIIVHDRRGREDWYCITPVLYQAIDRANILSYDRTSHRSR